MQQFLIRLGFAMAAFQGMQFDSQKELNEIQRGSISDRNSGMAEDINTKIAAQIKADATGPTTALGSTGLRGVQQAQHLWLIFLNMEDDMVQTGYPYRTHGC